MVTIPFLGRMVWDFVVLTENDVQKKFIWNCYVFLLAIFVAMTNQVLLILSEITNFLLFCCRFTNGLTPILDYRRGWCSFKNIT